MNQKNKLQIVNLLAKYIKLGAVANKAVIVNQKSQCFFVNQTNNCVSIPEINSLHREAYQKISMHAVYVGQDSSNEVCVIADDTDICLSMINIGHRVKSCLYFWQGKIKDPDLFSTRKNQKHKPCLSWSSKKFHFFKQNTWFLIKNKLLSITI